MCSSYSGSDATYLTFWISDAPDFQRSARDSGTPINCRRTLSSILAGGMH